MPTPRTQHIIDTLINDGCINPDTSASAADLLSAAYESNPNLFVGPPPANSAAATMTAIFRDTPEIHRVMHDRAFYYYYDAKKKTPRDIQERAPRVKPEVKPVVKPTPVAAEPARAENLTKWPDFNRTHAPFESKVDTEMSQKMLQASLPTQLMPSSTRVGGDYQIVRRPNGEPGGVVKDGIIYTSLPELVEALNTSARTT